MKDAITLIIFYKLLKIQLSNHIKILTKISCKDLQIGCPLFNSNKINISFKTKTNNFYLKMDLYDNHLKIVRNICNNNGINEILINYEADEYQLLLKSILYIISDQNPALRAYLLINFPELF